MCRAKCSEKYVEQNVRKKLLPTFSEIKKIRKVDQLILKISL